MLHENKTNDCIICSLYINSIIASPTMYVPADAIILNANVSDNRRD